MEMQIPDAEPVADIENAIIASLTPLMNANGFEWRRPPKYSFTSFSGQFVRHHPGGWMSLDLTIRTCGAHEVEFYLFVRARLNAFDELWMTKVLEMPDEIDQTAATVEVHLGTYLYQWSIPTAENYPAPVRDPVRAKHNDVSFYVATAAEARNMIRDYFFLPLHKTILPLILRCDTAQNILDAGQENRYFRLPSAAHRLTLMHLVGNVTAMGTLIAEEKGEENPEFEKAVKVFAR
jgi:hypothetical protein